MVRAVEKRTISIIKHFQLYNLDSLAIRRIKQDLVYTYKILYSYVELDSSKCILD